MRKLTIATRGSKLALWQAEHVKERILSTCQGVVEISLLVLKTKGDKILDVPLAKVGGKGLFVKEIEEALLDGRADLAVHSMKDMPVDLPSDLALGVITEREDPRDMFLSMRYPDLESIPSNGRIGTSSLRRQAQLLAFRPDIAIIPLRGNVDTRLRKLVEGEFDAIIMASAGMKRLGLSAPYMVPLPEATMLPAVGQGALGLEFRQDRPDIAAVLAPLDHEETRLCVMAERGFLAGLDGRCQAPMAAHAVVRNGTMTLKTLLCDPKGNRSFLEAADMEASLGAGAAFCLGRQIAEKTKLSGGDTLLAEIIGAAENNT